MMRMIWISFPSTADGASAPNVRWQEVPIIVDKDGRKDGHCLQGSDLSYTRVKEELVIAVHHMLAHYLGLWIHEKRSWSAVGVAHRHSL